MDLSEVPVCQNAAPFTTLQEEWEKGEGEHWEDDEPMSRIVLMALATVYVFAAEQPARSDSAPVRIGLALSGGAALGIAHIGVLKVLEREGIEICCISGNSMGSLVGGVYAAGHSIAEIESMVLSVNWAYLFSSDIAFFNLGLKAYRASHRVQTRLRVPAFQLLGSGEISVLSPAHVRCRDL